MSDTPKAPKLGDSYALFKKEVRLWENTTSIEVKKRAGTIVFTLPDKVKEQALEIPLEHLQDGKTVTVGTEERKYSGVDCLLEVLDELYLENAAKEKFKCYDRFRNLKRKENQDVRDFILEFDKALKQLAEHEIQLPEPVKAYELLRGCNVDKYKYSVAVAIVGKLTYDNMKTTVRNITEIKESDSSHGVKVVKEEQDHVQYYADSQNGLYDQGTESECFDQEDVYYGYGRGRGMPRGSQSRGRNHPRGMYKQGYSNPQKNYKGLNPIGRDGKQLTCRICQSINHFAKDCPDKKKTTSSAYLVAQEDIALFQQSGLNELTKQNYGLAILDSGCNTTVCGKQWLDVYMESLEEADKDNITWTESEMNFKFGDNESTQSTVCCTFPAILCEKKVTITAQVVEDMIPLLIGKQSMRKAKMILDFKNDTVTAFGVKQDLIFGDSGHCSVTLSPNTIHEDVCLCNTDNFVFLANASEDVKETALKLHKQFAHPPAESLKSLLKSAGELNKELASAIDAVSSNCDICRRYKKPASKPVVCMPYAKDFNDTVAMDIKVFDASKNIYFQHLIDHRTRFSTAKVVRSKGKETIVESVFTHWINVFGPPKKFMTDNGGEYVNESFMDLCEKFGVHVATTGAEAPWSNGLVERHHDLLSRNVRKIMEDTNCSIEVALAWACHAKNALSNINGFSPYQLLFGTNPVLKSISDPYVSPTVLEDETPSEIVAKNIAAIYSARRQQMKCEADEKIKRALKSNTREVYSEKLDMGDLVYYKREGNKRWRGPGTIVGCDGKLVIVRHGGYIVRCHRIHVVKVNDIYSRESTVKTDIGVNDPPLDSTQKDNSVMFPFNETRKMMRESLELPQYEANHITQPEDEEHLPANEQETIVHTEHENDALNVLEPTGVIEETPALTAKDVKLCQTKSTLEKKRLSVCSMDTDPFKDEKIAEIEKWTNNDVFEEVPIESMEDDAVPISTRWVTNDLPGKRKARLVARGFEEDPLAMTETVSPTCRKESLRILFTVTASMSWNLKSLDIASAFLQGKEIDRIVYLYPPKEFLKP